MKYCWKFLSIAALAVSTSPVIATEDAKDTVATVDSSSKEAEARKLPNQVYQQPVYHGGYGGKKGGSDYDYGGDYDYSSGYDYSYGGKKGGYTIGHPHPQPQQSYYGGKKGGYTTQYHVPPVLVAKGYIPPPKHVGKGGY
mmetsp:Transcript_7189/g.10650  ORF Transcript_7189/g.10650 Transcript_7189/m.10650 type:complete len:140 (+) Transcript_7189:26-445(+)